MCCFLSNLGPPRQRPIISAVLSFKTNRMNSTNYNKMSSCKHVFSPMTNYLHWLRTTHLTTIIDHLTEIVIRQADECGRDLSGGVPGGRWGSWSEWKEVGAGLGQGEQGKGKGGKRHWVKHKWHTKVKLLPKFKGKSWCQFLQWGEEVTEVVKYWGIWGTTTTKT